MSSASVTLASALQVRGEALSEEEIWSVLSLAVERLLEDLREGKNVFGAIDLWGGGGGFEYEAFRTNTFLGTASQSVIGPKYYNE